MKSLFLIVILLNLITLSACTDNGACVMYTNQHHKIIVDNEKLTDIHFFLNDYTGEKMVDTTNYKLIETRLVSDFEIYLVEEEEVGYFAYILKYVTEKKQTIFWLPEFAADEYASLQQLESKLDELENNLEWQDNVVYDDPYWNPVDALNGYEIHECE